MVVIVVGAIDSVGLLEGSSERDGYCVEMAEDMFDGLGACDKDGALDGC